MQRNCHIFKRENQDENMFESNECLVKDLDDHYTNLLYENLTFNSNHVMCNIC